MRDKEEHTLTQPWSKRMTKGGSKEEFVFKLAMCYGGFERYVECVKVE
jgi:hypothetical protein